jgi:hypothetical protein
MVLKLVLLQVHNLHRPMEGFRHGGSRDPFCEVGTLWSERGGARIAEELFRG